MEPEQGGTLARMDRSEVLAEADLLTRMGDAWQVTERPFTSKVPVLGPLIVFIRERWNRVATKWYMRGLLEQQNRFNELVLELARRVSDIQAGIEDRDRRIQVGLGDRDRRIQAGLGDRDRRIQAHFEMLNQLITQQADLVSDRGLSIAALAESVSRLSVHVADLEELVETTLPEAMEEEP